jgi:transketolase C-terminal domain/subunit
MLDLKLTRLGLSMKNLIVLDLNFPDGCLSEFKKAYPDRYIHMPCRLDSAIPMAGGMASFGKVVLICCRDCKECDLPDQTLNVKLIRKDKDAVWDYFEEGVKDFGPALLLIPED